MEVSPNNNSTSNSNVYNYSFNNCTVQWNWFAIARPEQIDVPSEPIINPAIASNTVMSPNIIIQPPSVPVNGAATTRAEQIDMPSEPPSISAEQSVKLYNHRCYN